MIDWQRLSLAATCLGRNEKQVVPEWGGRTIRKDLKEMETSWDGVKKEVLNRLGQRISIRSCFGLRRLGAAASYAYNLNPGLEWDDEFPAAYINKIVLTFDDHDEDSSLPPIDGGLGSRANMLPPGILPSGMPQVKEVKPAVTDVEKAKQEPLRQIKELSEEEKQMLVLSEEFQRFFDNSTRVVERALSENVDIFTDYAGGSESEDGLDDKSGYKLSLNRYFCDEKWSKNRCVTCLDWSPQHPELLLAAYHSREDAPHDPDGACLIWNTRFKKTSPEYTFHCQSPVTAATFAKFHPNLVLGGTYSGQLVLWDNRSQKKTPVQRSPLTATTHTHPVYCVSVVGTSNAHSLVSISTDGKLCSWSLDMLASPQETLELHHRQGKSVAATCMTFPQPQVDVNTFIVGSEDGSVYSACRQVTNIIISSLLKEGTVANLALWSYMMDIMALLQGLAVMAPQGLLTSLTYSSLHPLIGL
nr:EOG090X03UT [Artemia franciscana]